MSYIQKAILKPYTIPATKFSKSALSISTQLLPTFTVQLSPWEPEVPTQKQNILQAKILETTQVSRKAQTNNC